MIKRTIFGGRSDNYCAYCQLHGASLTVKQVKAKGCLQKQCWHLAKEERHPYWMQRDIIKQKRKERREIQNEYLKQVYG